MKNKIKFKNVIKKIQIKLSIKRSVIFGYTLKRKKIMKIVKK